MSDLLTILLDKFAAAEACWFGSVRPNGHAHLAPIWHVWSRNTGWIVTQPNAVRARNLVRNSSVCMSLPDPMNVIIIEGAGVHAPDATDVVRPLFMAKYDWDIATDVEYGSIIRITPSKVLAWGDHGDGRWRYDPATDTWTSVAR
jgi:hypothetical protein